MIRLFTSALAAIVIASGSLVATPDTAEAAVSKYRSNGWHVVRTNQRSASVVLRDRTPATGYGVVMLSKKAGPGKCRARVTFTRNGANTTRVYERYARSVKIRYATFRLRGGRDATVNVRISTNGRCVTWAGVR